MAGCCVAQPSPHCGSNCDRNDKGLKVPTRQDPGLGTRGGLAWDLQGSLAQDPGTTSKKDLDLQVACFPTV